MKVWGKFAHSYSVGSLNIIIMSMITIKMHGRRTWKKEPILKGKKGPYL